MHIAYCQRFIVNLFLQKNGHQPWNVIIIYSRTERLATRIDKCSSIFINDSIYALLLMLLELESMSNQHKAWINTFAIKVYDDNFHPGAWASNSNNNNRLVVELIHFLQCSILDRYTLHKLHGSWPTTLCRLSSVNPFFVSPFISCTFKHVQVTSGNVISNEIIFWKSTKTLMRKT